jgi:hypothetical protein
MLDPVLKPHGTCTEYCIHSADNLLHAVANQKAPVITTTTVETLNLFIFAHYAQSRYASGRESIFWK